MQSSLDEVKAQSMYIYNRVKKIIGQKERLWYLFANDHHKETFLQRTEKDSLDTWSTKCKYKRKYEITYNYLIFFSDM